MTNSLKQYVAAKPTSVKRYDAEQDDSTRREEWALVDALLGGTRAMRAAGETYLPRWPEEEVAAYTARLASSTLYNAFAHTVKILSSKPFSSAPTTVGFEGDRESWLSDADLQGVPLADFAKGLLRTGLCKGLAHVFVDYPRTEPGATLADERAANLRPYLVEYKPEQVVSYTSERINGAQKLTSLILSSHRFAIDPKQSTPGNDVVVCVERRLRVERGVGDAGCLWELFEKWPTDEDWKLVGDGLLTVKEIPFFTFYANREGVLQGRCPLIDLADLNASHWRSQSDQDNALHVARIPILFGAGFSEGDTVVVGASSAVRTTDPNAKLAFVEHSGTAIEAGRASLQDLEARMAALGAELLLKRQTGDKTATEAALEGASATCDLSSMVEGLERTVNAALECMAEYASTQPPTVTLFKDFAVDALGATDMDVLLKLNAVGALSSKTLLDEAKRRKLLDTKVDYEEEQENLLAEAETVAQRSQLLADAVGSDQNNERGDGGTP